MNQTLTIDDLTVASNCINKQIDALVEFQNILSAPSYANIINVLKSVVGQVPNYSRRIIITGVGKNASIATKVSESMASLGVPSFFLNTTHAAHGDFGFIGPDDVIIHLSRSGKTSEMLEASNYIRKIRPDVIQILLHCSADFSNDKLFDYCLFCGVAVEGDEHSLAPTTSTTLILAAMDTITCILSSYQNFQREDFLAYHPGGALGEMLHEEFSEK